ncbi:MAG: PA2169 family four-helix-bundle protein [Ferruginibacter sp.]
MNTNDSLISVLNDLIEINNDRIAGYEKAIRESQNDDVDLKGLFRNMANESQQYVLELSNLVTRLGGHPSDDTTAPGKVYRTWMDLKAVFTGSDRKALLNSCEYGEDAAQKAYQAALTSDTPIDTEGRQLIAEQQASLKKSHDVIKKYRDLQAAIA